MGAYLSEPKTEKESDDGTTGHLAYGASSMQGWRMSQEDAHNCFLNFDENVSLFAVYDGHGGHEVATYCSKNLPEFIKQTDAYKQGNMKQALIDAFLGFDATLATPKIINILKEIAGSKSDIENVDEDSDDEENINNLCEEANMPLEQVMAKYHGQQIPNVKSLKNESLVSLSNFASPCLGRRNSRDKASCSSSSSGAGCSSSTSASWNTNEADVSSSSQPCESSSAIPSTSNCKVNEAAGSSEAEQVLDSTTSNGDVPRASQVGSSADSQPSKSDMPDSSEDADDKVSPSKVSNSTSSQNEADMNGEKPSESFEAADSSKSNNSDNECSSSCTPVENGEADQQEKQISSSNRIKRKLVNMYKNILNEQEDDSDDDEMLDDDDEDDENYDDQQPLGDDDDDDDENDDDGDEDDDEDEDEDDEEEESSMELNEEPGFDSGCTAVVALLKGNELYVANAGDSRCVLCRDGEAIELSLDHKPEDELEMNRIVKAGGKVTADGRVNGGLNLSRALGDHAYKKNKDLPPEEQMISALPDIKTATIDVEKDEFMILACDGIWNFMSSQKVVDFVRTRLNQGYEKMSKICEELFDHCLAPSTLGDGTGCDNMTAIIVRFNKSEKGNNADNIEVTSVTKKRALSPQPTEEGADCSTAETAAEDINKRAKMEKC